MPKRYIQEIKRTALDLVNQGQTQIEVAQALGLSPKTLSHWIVTAQARMLEHLNSPQGIRRIKKNFENVLTFYPISRSFGSSGKMGKLHG